MELPKKGYVLSRVYYEYNDEIYDSLNTRESPGIPTKIFFSQKEANQECKRLNREFYLKECLLEYGYDKIDWCCNPTKFDEILEENELPPIVYGDTIGGLDTTDEVKDSLIKLLSLEFYTVIPVDFEDSPPEGRSLKEALDEESKS